MVDEADRLLTQSFHDWLPTVLSALKPTFSAASLREDETLPRSRQTKSLPRSAQVPEADALAPSWWDVDVQGANMSSDLDEPCLGSASLLPVHPNPWPPADKRFPPRSAKNCSSPPPCLVIPPRLTLCTCTDRSTSQSRMHSTRTPRTKESTTR